MTTWDESPPLGEAPLAKFVWFGRVALATVFMQERHPPNQFRLSGKPKVAGRMVPGDGGAATPIEMMYLSA